MRPPARPLAAPLTTPSATALLRGSEPALVLDELEAALEEVAA